MTKMNLVERIGVLNELQTQIEVLRSSAKGCRAYAEQYDDGEPASSYYTMAKYKDLTAELLEKLAETI